MTSSTEPLVSILTPVYNGAEYLAECIESVLAQTYQNWEYTIVNNCSTDGSGEIARVYAAKNSRIRVLDNESFLRAISNQNVAFRQTSPISKYCKMVFADDWLFPECLKRMVALAEAHPTVGIVGAYGLQGGTVMWTGLPYPSTVIPGREICRRRLLNGRYVFGTATSNLLLADLVRRREPFYNESNLHADSEVCFELLQSSDFGFVHQVLTYTRAPRADSLATLSNTWNTLLPATLYELVRYGPVFLTADELQTCLRGKLSEYYEFLARNALQGRDRKFWDFHKKKLSMVGLNLDRSRLARTVCVKALNALLNPKQTVEDLFDRTGVLSGRLQSLTRQKRPLQVFIRKRPYET